MQNTFYKLYTSFNVNVVCSHQEEIREVFEGSCRLIPIKVLADECVHVADDFIPELIETLASQMNPQVVCATAGLCNSFRVDRLLREYQVSVGSFYQ